MSDTVITFIPQNPRYTPTAAQIEEVTSFLQGEFHFHQVSVDSSQGIQFRDCGANFESVRCPFCECDLMEDWGEAMTNDFDGEQFQLDDLETSCCGKLTNLNGLTYNMEQGFSCFALVISDEMSEESPRRILEIMQDLLGVFFKVITRRI